MTLLLSCASPELTQILLCYDVDAETAALPGFEASVCVRPLETDEVTLVGCEEGFAVDPSSGPSSQGFVPRRYEGIDAELIGTWTSAGGREERLSQRLRLAFASGRILDARLRLTDSCREADSCGEEETCVDGACRPTEVGERCLTDHGSAPVPDEACDSRTVTVCNP